MNLHCSQTGQVLLPMHYRFIPLWIYIALKHVLYHYYPHCSFIPLWIYIALKQPTFTCLNNTSFIPLWIYIALKHPWGILCCEYSFIPLWIYIALKLTSDILLDIRVLYLYEFTLLSNDLSTLGALSVVLYLYEFTLLSNIYVLCFNSLIVLYLYEFTLLSNLDHCLVITPLFYTSMNLHCSQTSNFENPACNWYVNPHLCYTFLYNKYQHISFLIP